MKTVLITTTESFGFLMKLPSGIEHRYACEPGAWRWPTRLVVEQMPDGVRFLVEERFSASDATTTFEVPYGTVFQITNEFDIPIGESKTAHKWYRDCELGYTPPRFSWEEMPHSAPWRVVEVVPGLINVKDRHDNPVLALDNAQPGTENGILAAHIARLPEYSALVGLVLANEYANALKLAQTIADDVEVMS